MDKEHEIASLGAETIALQAVLTNVLHQLALSNPDLGGAIRLGLDNAANEIESLAITAGKTARPDHLVKALGIVEELRTMTLGKRDKPKGGV
jgi:hypothetical protein